MGRKKKADPNPLEVTMSMVDALNEAEGVDPLQAFTDSLPEAPEDPSSVTPQPPVATTVIPDSPVKNLDTDGHDPAAPPDEDEFPDFLLNAAGLTAEQAKKAYGTSDALANAIHAFDARTMQAGSQALKQAPASPAAPTAPASQAAPLPEAPASQDEYEMPSPSHEGEWDEDAKRLITSLRQYHDRQLAKRDAEIATQRDMLQKLMSTQQDGEQINYVTQFDSFVDRLGEKWSPVFGQGSGTVMPRDSMAFQNRIQLDMAAAQLAAGRRALGAADLPVEDLLARALYVAFPEHIKTEARQDVSDQLAARRQQFTSRPSSSKAPAASGRDQAIRHADDWYKAKGLGSDGIFDTSVL